MQGPHPVPEVAAHDEDGVRAAGDEPFEDGVDGGDPAS